MTNEEIAGKAQSIAEIVVDMCTISAPRSTKIDAGRIVGDLVRSLVSLAYEEAARRVCLYCLREYALHEYAGGGWYHTDAEGHEWQCAGSKARALRDSLVPVESAST